MIIWELDFYSRPILDEQQKKVWEVLICESALDSRTDPKTLFRYAQYCPGSQVNSIWLKAALEEAIAQADRPPDKIRFFRQAMNNMITKACEDAGIPAQLSRRTFVLHQWLQERLETVYPLEPGYQAGMNPSVAFPTSQPQRLPDALIGQQWAFVNLAVKDFEDMAEWQIDFGEAFPLTVVDLPSEAQIPGLVIFSPRALALAGWLSGLELAGLKYEPDPARLLLETGMNDRWILANLPTAPLQTEAEQFEAAKQHSQQVHFLAVQTDPQAETFAGFWLLQEVNLA
jgi:hypothetical protein